MGKRLKMTVDRILGRLDSLIDMGERVLETECQRSWDDVLWADDTLFTQWYTSCLAFLNTLPSEYIYHREFVNCCKSARSYDVKQGVAILRAAKEDIEGGHLQRVEVLVSASVFSDFLEMAEHLLGNGYKDPTASLIGAVLENNLRRMCRDKNIPVRSDDNISSLNQKLADKDVYNRLQQREIEVWNKLRDYADHGHFDEYKEDDVKGMLAGVQNFLSSYLV